MNLVVGFGCAGGAAIYALSKPGRLKIKDLQQKATTRLAQINRDFPEKIIQGKQTRVPMPFGTKITKKFWEKAADPIPKPMQTNMRKIFGADYELYVYAMAAYAIAGYLSGYFQLPLLYTAYMLSEFTAVKSHQWHVTETFGLQRIYPFAQECDLI